jgi:LacI family transcriptional regulator
MAKKVTMQQIADELGVSKFVVSKALSGKGGVSDTTKERVIQTASQLGYFNQQKVQLKQTELEELGASQTAGKQSVIVLMSDMRFQNKHSLYWGRILDGISVRLEKAGIGMLMMPEQSVEHSLQMMNPKGILGVISVGIIASGILLDIHRKGIAIVLVDHEDPLIPTDTVFVNNYDSMFRLTNHLIGIGHHELRFIGNERFSRSFNDRWMGFRAAVEGYGCYGLPKDMLRLALDEDPQQPYEEQIRQWLRSLLLGPEPRPTAFVCGNDTIAYLAIRMAEELGFSVPGDVTVTGFDNIEDSARFIPPVTTINVPKEVLGRRAVEKLLERVRRGNEPLEKLLVACDIVYRQSSGKPVLGV